MRRVCVPPCPVLPLATRRVCVPPCPVLPLQCAYGLAPRVRLVLPRPSADIAHIVWRDNANRTFARGRDALTVSLPPLSPLAAWAGASAPRCTVGCDRAYHVSPELPPQGLGSCPAATPLPL
jgi:hypothetical protein